MAWYATGTISVTNGSTSVTGSGTQFITGAQVGEGLLENGQLYEIQSIESATSLTLAKTYLGATQSGLNYEIVPTQSLVADLANNVSSLIGDFQSVVDNAGAGKFSDGTVATPGISFTQDQNNGLYRIGADNWGLVAGGVKVVDVTSTGIDVAGTATMGGLTVRAPSGDTPVNITTTTSGSFLGFTDTNTISGRSPLVGVIGDDLVIYTSEGSYSEKLRIDSSGRVGIGGLASAKLAVHGDGLTVRLDGTADTSRGILMRNVGGSAEGIIQSDGNMHFLQEDAGKYLRFSTSSAEAMRIDSSGRLLVGTTSTLRSNKFHASSSNFVGGFNVTSGTGEAISFFSNGTVVGSVSVTGSATTYNTSSDQRLKENIADADDAGNKIDAIQVRKYDWKADGSHQDYGMIAQELQAVAPEAVSGDADSEEMMGVDYSKLVPMLIKEVQSLRNRVAQLEG